MLDPKKFPSTKYFVVLESIKDGMIVLKGGIVRAVLAVSSVNFALKSQEEQDAIIYRFQQLLNALDFSLQIVIHSRKLNIDPYLGQIKERERLQENEFLRVQISEYHDFVQSLVEHSNIMTKSFYVVVPFSAGEETRKKGVKSIFHKKMLSFSEERLAQLKTQLWQRVEFIAVNLHAMGMRAVPLNTQELIELFYRLYNPERKEKTGLAAVDQLDVEM